MSKLDITSPILSVALTCDFLRSQLTTQGFSNFQYRNLGWLARVIGAHSTWENWGVKTSVITAPQEAQAFRSCLNHDDIFSEFQDNADKTWASLFDIEEFTIFPELLDQLLARDLVVGFELPPTLKRALDKAGKRYISFYIHPVRFLRDLCFLVTTNCVHIAKLITQNEIPSKEIDYQARRFSALFSRLQLPALSLPNQVPILIGQTARDSVLIREGRFITWEDYEGALAETLKSHSDVIFLEHPYRKNSAETTEYLRGRHGKNVVSIRGNSYGVIFSQIETPFFLTLGSSLGVEARCAGQKCIFLSNDPCEKFILDGVDIPNTAMVSHAVLQDEFWKTIFSGKDQKRKIKTEAFPLGDHFVRNSLESWAFRPLQSGSALDPVLKQVLPSAAAMEQNIAAIGTALCGESLGAAEQLIAHGRTEQTWGTVEILAKPFAQGIRTEIDFSRSSASHYLVEGFHTSESWGVWSSGKYAKLVLPLDVSDISEAKIDISMGIKVFAATLAHAPVLQVMIDGKEVGVVLFRKSSKNEQQVHFTCPTKNPICQIEFFISHTGSPATFSQSTDHRILGFGICSLSVELSSVDENSQIDTLPGISKVFWGISHDENDDDDKEKAQEGRME